MDMKQLLEVLAQGQEQAKQLEAQLDDNDRSATAAHQCRSLAQRIESTFQTAISMMSEGPQRAIMGTGDDSPACDSPSSEGSDRMLMDHERTEMFKKRKNMPRWSKQVRVCSGGGVEEALADGYTWRKYGQNVILGSQNPRGYYRCTHRKSKGCLATKHVQRSDEDTCVFAITYRGAHTCSEKLELAVAKEGNSQPDAGADPPRDLLQHLQTQDQLQLNNIDFVGSYDPIQFGSAPVLDSDYFPYSDCQYGEGPSNANPSLVDMDFGAQEDELIGPFPFDGSDFF